MFDDGRLNSVYSAFCILWYNGNAKHRSCAFVHRAFYGRQKRRQAVRTPSKKVQALEKFLSSPSPSTKILRHFLDLLAKG